jgi:hypothetical protein
MGLRPIKPLQVMPKPCQPTLALRMFKYFTRLHEKHRLLVYPIAVLS